MRERTEYWFGTRMEVDSWGTRVNGGGPKGYQAYLAAEAASKHSWKKCEHSTEVSRSR